MGIAVFITHVIVFKKKIIDYKTAILVAFFPTF